MKKRLFAMILALCLGLMSVPVLADTVDSVWNDDFGVLFTTTSSFHPDWGLYDDQYSIQTITGYSGSDTDIVLPSVDADGEPIQAINDNAFQNKTNLTSVTIPDSFSSIGQNAFSGCTGLTSVTMPDSILKIGFGAFSNCSSLSNITLSSSLMDIPQSAFFYCTQLSNVVIPNGATTIGNSAFWGCSSLSSITIPTSVTSIEYGAFMQCSSLTDVYYTGTADQWAAISVNNDQNYNSAILAANIHFGADVPNQPVPSVAGFADVTADAYYAAPVEWAVAQQITSGTSDTTFSPDDTCTKAQIITFLWRAAGSPEPQNVAAFSDVAVDAYYAKATAWAAENGMAEGDVFEPESPCTRLMAVEFMWKQAGSPGAANASFTDVSSDAVNWALEQGVTSGTGDTTFSPDDTCTRGQIVTFLYRAFA